MTPDMAELTGTARNPIPNGAVTGTIGAVGGGFLRYARWDTTAERRIGTVCLFQGRAEFIEKYFETITDLRRRGFAVATMDWRGQGGSSRFLKNSAKNHADNFAQFDADARQFMSEVVLPDCPPPYYCLAHSMGAHLVLRLVHTKVCWWERLVLTAPAIQFAGTGFRKSMINAGAEAATLMGFGDCFVPGGKPHAQDELSFEGNPLTSDRLRFERSQEMLRAAPRLAVGSPTIGWVAAAANSMNLLNAPQFMEKITVPILIVASANDRLVCTASIENFASRLKNCVRLIIAGSKHEILQERDQFRDQFWAAFDAFIPGAAAASSARSHQPELVR